MSAKKSKAAPVAAEPSLICFKGFNAQLQCTGGGEAFQYEVGKTYTHTGAVEACSSGFHSCESPFDVWRYYGPIDSRFAEVEVSGELSRHGGDTKIASATITIKAELTMPQFIQRGIDWLMNLTKDVPASVDGVVANSEDGAQIGSSGNGAQIGSSGNGAQIGSSGYDARIGSSGYGARIGSSGNGAQIGSSGNGAQIGSSGYDARIGSSGYGARIGSSGNGAQIGSSGNDAQIGSSGNGAQIGSSGNGAQIGSSGYGAQIGSSGNGARIGSSGYDARIGSSGYGARIGSSGNGAQIGSSGNGARIGSSGNGAQIEASGADAIVACAASVYRFKLGENGCICIPYHDGKRARFASAYVGENGIKAGVWYETNGAAFVEVTA
jgi:hypothetical protein